ncbi:MAG: phosphoribosylformylglycinamidine cyclo-ligase [Actinobacteria bacterium]|nr:phosphoribosylformylglycinamidine cyclo-ligase [Actinomycetota bacterium]MBW3647719.1 phosphoribosylformylglycinamidine cyclo-ligase [Actinomycetota bacterium]
MNDSTYSASGVDIDAGDRAVELMRGRVAGASRPEVVGGIGGFAGLFRLDTDRWKRPLLASSTDGVGTKLAIAQALDKHDTVGIDLVGMVVDDLVVCGAEPLFLQDYVACGQVVPERIAEIVGGIAAGCELAGCALVGGETAEHPGLMPVDHYDLAGTGVGVVEEDKVLGAELVREGDVVIAMGSSGLHSNGFSLVRHVLLQGARMRLDAIVDELGGPLGEQLLVPTRIYAKDCLSLIEESEVHAFAHVTGGGLAGNLSRVLPPHLSATVDRGTWTPQPIFDLVRGRGRVEPAEMERTFNMGVGMVALVAPADVDRALAVLTARHVPAWVAGVVVPGEGSVTLTGSHPT